MITAQESNNEIDRIHALKEYQILDTRAEAGFDALTNLASMICETPISLVSLIDEKRQWFKSNKGLPGVSETARDIAFCAHAILDTDLFEISDTTLDQRFHDNPLVTGDPNIRFYAGMPLITHEGYALGTLCVIDRQPKVLSDFQRKALSEIAKSVISLIEASKGDYRLLQVITHAPYGALVVDENNSILMANESLIKLLGFDVHELVGRSLNDFLSISHENANSDHLEHVLFLDDHAEISEHPSNQSMVSKAGRKIPVEIYLTPIGEGRTAYMIIDISARLLIAENAEKSRDELQSIIDQVPAKIGYWDSDLRNQFGNKTYIQWFGFHPREMKGKHMREVLGEERFQLNFNYIQGALHGEPQMFERTIIDSTGIKRHTLASYTPDIEDGKVKGFFAFVNDITLLKNAEVARLEAEAQLQAVFDSAIGFAIITTNLDGVIKIFSRGAELMLGYQADEVINKQSPLLIHDPDEVNTRRNELSIELGYEINGIDIFVHRIRQGGIEEQDWTYCRKDGSTLLVHLIVSGIRSPSGELVGFLGVAHDITEERKYQVNLKAAKEAAEAASQAKSSFVANMSHEIRTPMNAVLGITSLLANMALPSKERTYLDMIRLAGESLLSIINDILDFAKIEAGKLEIEHKPFDLDSILRQVSTIMMINCAKKPIELVIDVAESIPNFLMGDSLRLQQILNNLVSNATKFTNHGEISLRVTLAKRENSKVFLHFEVNDSGIGISPEQQSKLFKAFTQADISTTRQFGGTGLGLVISKYLVEIMGGKIGLMSDIGEGSCFWFDLPFEEVSDAEISVLPQPILGIQSVLVAEKNINTLKAFTQIMSHWGWKIDSATQIDSIIDQFEQKRKEGFQYDLLIIDCEILLSKNIQKNETLKHIIQSTSTFISGNPYDRQKIEEVYSSELFKGIIAKPFTALSLLDLLQEALSKAPAHQKLINYSSKNDLSAHHDLISGFKILVVEDNEFNQIVAQGLLESSGAIVEIAKDGQCAVDLLKTRHTEFDLILMDVQMPVMDGFQATKFIRDELRLQLPIIAMSAGVLISEQEQCRNVGMNDFIAKPIDVKQMIDVIARHVSKRDLVTQETERHIVSEESDVNHRVDFLQNGKFRLETFVQEKNALPVILLVDDQVLHIHHLYQIFEQDYEVFNARNGSEALDFCKTRRPDLILLDVMMPEMDGYEVCRRLKSDSLTSDIPIIFITAHNDIEEEEKGLALGAVDVISRSASQRVIKARVQTHIQLKYQTDLLRSLALVDGLT